MQPISILKEIYTFKDQDSLSFFLDSIVEGEPTESRIQKYLQFRNQKEGLICPECGSEKFIKNGKTKTKKVQKYRCKRCGKGFRTLRFRGVATKYLQNYLNWYLVEVQYKGFHQYLDLFMMLAIYNRQGIENYKSCKLFTG